jgi:hypothetical protein
VHHQPADKGAELVRSEERNFEHAWGVRALRSCVQGVYSQFWNYKFIY